MPSRRALPVPKTAIGFKPEFLDFQRGIRVGNLEDNERITRILKIELESRYQQDFVTERWGRGVFWQWIGYLPRENRTIKPISSKVSFGCSKFFVMVDTGQRVFKCGMQVERGFVKAPREHPQCRLQPDWDWHRLLTSMKPAGQMERELRRLLVREGFRLFAGTWESDAGEISGSDFPGAVRIARMLKSAPGDHWAGFQVYYPFGENEVRSMTGLDLVESMVAVFKEVTPVMNLCMQIHLRMC
ncbi:MAG TPA: hypothetical protein VE398_01910 [Acidobacteriota bacterium]|nr:hypothetical protein [Acidobacteriota bacterium]